MGTRRRQASADLRNLIAKARLWFEKGPTSERLADVALEWSQELKGYEMRIIKEALKNIRKESPEWFPGIGKVEGACRSIIAKEKREQQERERKAAEYEDDQEYREYINGIPKDPELQRQWINAAPNECEKLGRQWAVESKLAGGNPNRQITPAEFRHRVDLLVAAMGR